MSWQTSLEDLILFQCNEKCLQLSMVIDNLFTHRKISSQLFTVGASVSFTVYHNLEALLKLEQLKQ